MAEPIFFDVPSQPSTLAFVGIVASLALALVLAVRRASADGRDRWTLGTLLGLGLWLGITGQVPDSGFLDRDLPVPPTMVFFGMCVLVAVVLTLSPLGRRLVGGTSIAWLLGFQAFRLPLELVLHSWVEQGSIPSQMSWQGQNFDIVAGVIALVFGLVAMRRAPPRAAVWVVNLVCFGLLLNVMRVAALSSPGPLLRFLDEPPLLLAYQFPYVWILSVCVAGALFGHLLVFRWLWTHRAADTPAPSPENQ